MRPEVTEPMLQHGKLLQRFVEALRHVAPDHPLTQDQSHGLREFGRLQYFASFLLGLFNPIVQSMRGICRATSLPQVRQWLGLKKKIEPSQFSDAQHCFSPAILRDIMRHLLDQSKARQALVQAFGRITPENIRIVDSTLWKVVAGMTWAKWRFQNKEQNAVRLHMELRLLDTQAAKVSVTEGRTCERAAFKANLEPGIFYIGDRNYSFSHDLLNKMVATGCGFLMRIRTSTKLTLIQEAAVDAISAEDGCDLDARVILGGGKNAQRSVELRVIRFQRKNMAEPILLVTTASVEELSAHEAMELYRQRWQVEMFFRWLKCTLPCRHWFAHSQEGVQIQIYLCLIQALLLAESLGHKPTRRQMELLQWYQLGQCDETQLAAELVAESKRRAQLAQRRADDREAIKRGMAALGDM